MDNLEVFKEITRAFNDHNLDRIMSFFADNCSLDMPRGSEPWGTRYIGKEEVRRELAIRFETVPDVHYREDRYTVLWRIQTVKRANTRAKRIKEFVDMLARGEELH